MTDILFLRGASAFSAFRLQGLQQRIQALEQENLQLQQQLTLKGE